MADLSKIKLGTTTYNLKDAQARANITTLLGSHDLAALGDAAWKGVVASIGSGMTEGDLTTGKAVKDYVESMIETIPEFDVIVVPEGQNLPTASADTFHKIYLQAASSPASPNLYIEWITVRSGNEGSYTYSWEKIGDTAMDLSGYVQKTQKIAGIDLQDDITVAELQAALDLGNLAYANTASVTVGDYATGITGASYTPAGDVTLNAFTQTSTAATLTKVDYTPAGSVSLAKDAGGLQIEGTVSKPAVTVDDSAVDTFVKSLKAGTVDAAAFTEGTFTPNVPTALDLSKFSGGSKAADSFTANTPTSLDLTKFNGGSAATWTGAAHTAASLGAASKAQFAQEGLVGEVGTGDDAETLILTAATKANAVTEQGTFTPDTVDFGTFNGGSAASLAEGFYSAGSAAEFTEGAFTAASLANGFYTPGSAANKLADSFSANKLPVVDATGSAVTEVSAELAAAPVFTGASYKATFAGTEVEDFQVTGVNYDKATANGASFAGTAATITPTLAKGDKKITVSPDAKV